MKINNLYIYLCTVLLMVGCSDITDNNVDPKRPAIVSAESTFTNAQKNLADLTTRMANGSNVFRLWAQHWTETTYTDEANYDIIGRDNSRGYWVTIYTNVLQDLKSARFAIDEDILLDASIKANQLALINLMEVYSIQVLVDLNGDVPYTEILNVDENLFPAYDDAFTIYKDLITRTTDAELTLQGGGDSFGGADIFYAGDTEKWRKFANTLKLRLGMRIADFDQALASSTVQSAVNNGLFTSSEDSAIITYENAPPNTNPLYDLFVLQSRGQDYIAGATSVDYLNSVNDPRRQFFFDDNMDDDATPEVEYIGGPIGGNNTYANYTHINPNIVENATYPGALLEYFEVQFFLAEAVERNFIPGDAAAYYTAGVTESIIINGGTAAEATAYLAQPEVAYATATGGYKQKIGTQKWIALFHRGFEAWTEYRRLDFPQLVNSEISNLPVPTRIFYPTEEPALNGANYNAAVSKLGEDTLYERIFWDVN